MNTFAITFLCVIPLLSRFYHITYWGESTDIFIDYYPLAAIVTFVCVLAFNATYYVYRTKKKLAIPANLEYKIISWRVVVVSWTAFFLIAAVNDFSILSMMVRGGDLKAQSGPESQILHLVYSTVIYPIPAVCFCLYATSSRRRALVMATLAMPLLIGNSPTGSARFIAGAIYISAMVSIFPSLKVSNIKIPAIIILGIVVAFPTLDQFRYYEGGLPSIRILGMESLEAGHFDSFQSITSALQHPVTLGYQLLGVFLFWVPRFIWPSKPIGSGAEYADYAGLTFSNISMNLFGEGIINFGIPGALMFSILAAIISRKVDDKSSSHQASPRDKIISSFMIGMAFFIMRGDLLSSFAFSIGLLTSIYLISWVSTKTIRT